MPKISVIIPVYNTEQYLAQCLDSVLGQTFHDIEIICVNDGSTDNSLQILTQYAKRDNRIMVINQQNSGVVAARNNAIAVAKSDLIFPLDSDDFIAPNALEKMYECFKSGCGDIITCRVMLCGNQSGEMRLHKPTKFNMARDNCLVNAALFRKSDFVACGGYSPKYYTALEDYDLWLNLIFNHNKQIYRVPEILFYYRIKNKADSRNWQHRTEHRELVRQMYRQYNKMRPFIILNKIRNHIIKFGHFLFRIQNGKIKIFKIPVYTLHKYDTVISVGAACFVPDALKRVKLRDFSGPFDWMHGSNVITRLQCVFDEFHDYFNYDDFEYVAENPDNGKSIYKNNRTGIIYNHDFYPGDFEKTFPPVAEKYARRTNRMLEHLNGDKRVLLVFSEFGQTGNVDEIIAMIDKINKKFAANIDLLYVNHNPEMHPGKYTKPKRVSKNLIYCEYYYQTFPDETSMARKTLEKILRKIAK